MNIKWGYLITGIAMVLTSALSYTLGLLFTGCCVLAYLLTIASEKIDAKRFDNKDK